MPKRRATSWMTRRAVVRARECGRPVGVAVLRAGVQAEGRAMPRATAVAVLRAGVPAGRRAAEPRA